MKKFIMILLCSLLSLTGVVSFGDDSHIQMPWAKTITVDSHVTSYALKASDFNWNGTIVIDGMHASEEREIVLEKLDYGMNVYRAALVINTVNRNEFRSKILVIYREAPADLLKNFEIVTSNEGCNLDVNQFHYDVSLKEPERELKCKLTGESGQMYEIYSDGVMYIGGTILNDNEVRDISIPLDLGDNIIDVRMIWGKDAARRYTFVIHNGNDGRYLDDLEILGGKLNQTFNGLSGNYTLTTSGSATQFQQTVSTTTGAGILIRPIKEVVDDEYTTYINGVPYTKNDYHLGKYVALGAGETGFDIKLLNKEQDEIHYNITVLEGKAELYGIVYDDQPYYVSRNSNEINIKVPNEINSIKFKTLFASPGSVVVDGKTYGKLELTEAINIKEKNNTIPITVYNESGNASEYLLKVQKEIDGLDIGMTIKYGNQTLHYDVGETPTTIEFMSKENVNNPLVITSIELYDENALVWVNDKAYYFPGNLEGNINQIAAIRFLQGVNIRIAAEVDGETKYKDYNIIFLDK